MGRLRVLRGSWQSKVEVEGEPPPSRGRCPAAGAGRALASTCTTLEAVPAHRSVLSECFQHRA